VAHDAVPSRKGRKREYRKKKMAGRTMYSSIGYGISVSD